MKGEYLEIKVKLKDKWDELGESKRKLDKYESEWNHKKFVYIRLPKY